MNYSPEKVPSVQSSVNLKSPGKFKFDLWSCIISTKSPAVIGNTALIIGYIENAVNDYDYVVIPNDVTDSDVLVRVVGKEHLEEFFAQCERPNKGFLRTPKKGDTVMCVAKGRYSGVQGGEVCEVLGMPQGRINIHEHSQVTYEDTYFVVYKTASETAYINPCGEIKLPLPGEIKLPLPKFENYSDSLQQLVGKNTDSSDLSKRLSFKSLIEENKIKKRVVLEADKLIIRKKFEEPKIKKREIFNPKTIQRIK